MDVEVRVVRIGVVVTSGHSEKMDEVEASQWVNVVIQVVVKTNNSGSGRFDRGEVVGEGIVTRGTANDHDSGY